MRDVPTLHTIFRGFLAAVVIVNIALLFPNDKDSCNAPCHYVMDYTDTLGVNHRMVSIEANGSVYLDWDAVNVAKNSRSDAAQEAAAMLIAARDNPRIYTRLFDAIRYRTWQPLVTPPDCLPPTHQPQKDAMR